MAKVLPLKANALTASLVAQSYNKGPPFAVERCQYTGPPRRDDAPIVYFCTTPLSVEVYFPRLLVLST